MRDIRTKGFVLVRISIISARSVWFVFFLSAALICGSAFFATKLLERRLLVDQKENLIAVRDSVHEGLKVWRQEHEELVQHFARDPDILKSALALLREEPTKPNLQYSVELKKLRILLKPIIEAKGYRGFFLVGRDLVNYASMRDANLGIETLLAEQHHFIDGILNGYPRVSTPLISDVPLENSRGELVEGYPTMFVGAPLRDLNQEVRGMLLFRIDPFKGYTDIFKVGQIGRSGESYAFSHEGYMLSESRFSSALRTVGLLPHNRSAIGRVKVEDPGYDLTAELGPVSVQESNGKKTLMFQSALREGTGYDLQGYRDYRGVQVVGAWLWDERSDLGIATEIDVSDAFSSIHFLYLIAVLGVGVTLVLALIACLIFLKLQNQRGKVLQIELEREKEREVNERTASYKLASEEAMETVTAKSRIFASVTHELRTPLNSIIGLTDLLLESKLNSDQRSMASTVYSSAQALLNVINDLLDLSKLEAGNFTINSSPYRLRPFIKSMERLFAPQFSERGVRLEVEIARKLPDRFIGDSSRIQQVLVNLISNALRYSEEGSLVKLKVSEARSLEESDVRRVRFEVSDSGIGISSDKLKTIFEPFQQAGESIALDKRGTGLGLAIVKELLELMDGEISIDSEPGSGTTVTFTIPMLLELSQSDIEGDSTEKKKARSLKVLVAEDNPENQAYICRILESEGHQVTVVENGAEALKKLEEDSYDIIFMDILMPVMDGFEATIVLRKREADGSSIPVIATTAYATAGDEDQFLAAGMDALIPKPFVKSELKEVLHSILH